MFGLGSLLLAVVSTSCNIVAVVEDGIDWLQHMLLAAILWQIWLGWWWWVGSGMGIGEVEVCLFDCIPLLGACWCSGGNDGEQTSGDVAVGSRDE